LDTDCGTFVMANLFIHHIVTQSQVRFAVNDFSDDSEGYCERRSVDEL